MFDCQTINLLIFFRFPVKTLPVYRYILQAFHRQSFQLHRRRRLLQIDVLYDEHYTLR